MSARIVLRSGIALALMLAVSQASAQDRRTEAQARDAIKKAQLEALTHNWDGAIARLNKAIAACSPIKCSTVTRASLLRDRGVMEVRKGDTAAASVSFAEALRLDPKTELGSGADSPDVRAEWRTAKEERSKASEQPPSGDFIHTNPSEQAEKTPLPIYVEYNGTSAVATVVVKYMPSGATTYKRVTLPRKNSGWGGMIPCGDVTAGVLKYYIQGFDKDESPVALSGDPKRPYSVVIRKSISGPAPSLPGEAPPATCEGAAATASEDIPPEDQPVETPTGPRPYARVWIGVAGSIDFVPLASVDDACKLTQSAAPNTSPPYYCTNPDGTDFPSRRSTDENDSLQRGNAGKVDGGLHGGTIHAMASLDYALSANALIGARIGYVAHTYPGDAAAHDGATSSLPLHLEARLSLLFGEEPLARSGFAPLAFLAAGFADVAASSSTQVLRDGVPGQWPVNAWRTSGPWFAGIGLGVRYAFSPRVAFLAAMRVNAGFGGGVVLSGAPELAVQYGF